MRAKSILIAIFAAVPLFFFSSCHSSSHPDSDDHSHAEDAHAHESLGPDDVHFSDSQAESVGLSVVAVSPDSSFAPVISCSGVVEAQAAGSVTVVAPQSGVVSLTGTRLAPGAYLAKGQSVATISGKSMQDGDAAVKAKNEYAAAEKDFERASKLVAGNIISQKEYEDAKLRRDNALSAYQAIGGRMTAGGVAVVSPVAGHMVSVMAEQGQFVSAGQAIAIIERCGSKRLRADVPERHFASLRRVVSANFSTSAADSVFRLADLDGRLVSVGVSVSDGSSYVPVTFDFSDPDELFLAGSAARVYLVLGNGVERPALTVPCESIVESQGVKFVYVRDAVDSDVYHRREVKVGGTDGLKTEILTGLRAGDVVVVKGARRIHLAGASGAIPAHNHSH